MKGPFPTLDISADLRLTVDGRVVRITGEGSRVIVDLPSVRTGAALIKSGPFPGRRGQRITQLDRLLRAAGLTANVRVRGTRIARLGRLARPADVGRLARLADVGTRSRSTIRRAVGRTARVGLPLTATLAVLIWYLRKRA